MQCQIDNSMRCPTVTKHIVYVMDLPGDEERHIGRALHHCVHLRHTLRLSLVQVILLNRKHSAPTLTATPATPTTPAASPSADRRIARPHSSAIQLRTGRNTDGDPMALRLTASEPRVYRPLGAIQSQCNNVCVQLIKIRRQIEGVLLCVEWLRRAYGQRMAAIAPTDSPANRRSTTANAMRRLSQPSVAVHCHSCRTGALAER